MSKAKTLKRAGKENYIVYISAWSPLYLLRSLNNLETLKTLKIRASCGPTLKNFRFTELS